MTNSLPIKNFAQNKEFIEKDEIVLANDSIINDSIYTKSNKNQNNVLDMQVKYSATDSIVLASKSKKVFLYKEAKIEYGDIILEADYIEYDQERNFVFARGVVDSLGETTGKPKFNEKNEEFVARTIKYNFKTKKAYIQDLFTEEEQGFLHSKETKKSADNSFQLSNGKYTTCDLEHPHFYLHMNKAKIIPNDKIISGPAYLVFQDIPIKVIGVPFAFFPSQKGFSSGIIPPKYGEERKRGFFLRDGGYYFGISDKMDLAVTGEIYSKGSWSSKVAYKYVKRYKFRSNFNFSYAEFITGEEGEDNYIKSKDMRIVWNHSQDPKANPTSKFSASVNYSTKSFDKFNSTTIAQRTTNTKSSSISYGKSWPGSPFRFNTRINYSQNTNTENVSLTLPVMTFNMDRKYPFRRKNSSGETKWYEDIEIQYSSKLENRITTADSLLFHGTTFSDFENGFQHSIPLSTNFKILNHFNLSPRLEYTGILYPNYVEYTSDTLRDSGTGNLYVETIKDTISGIKYAQIVKPSISLSVGPNIYGMYQIKNPDAKIIAVRHVITPSVSASYRPDLGSMVNGYYSTYYTDTLKTQTKEYSIFDNGIYKFPAAPGESGSISFGLNNNLEMKVRDYEDTTGTGTKKIKLLESLKLSTKYDIFDDSLNWTQLSISGRTSMFENKLSFKFGAIVDPYAINDEGRVYNEFQWNTDEGGLGRLEKVDFSVDIRMKSKKGSDDKEGSTNDRAEFPGRNELNNLRNGYTSEIPDQIIPYVDFDIPWNLSANYKFVYTKTGLESSKRIVQTLGITGDFKLTQNWKISFRANYDIEQRKLTASSLNIHRELHCWEMSFSWIPVGYMQSYTFTIHVKGSTLRDILTHEKRKSWQDNL